MSLRSTFAVAWLTLLSACASHATVPVEGATFIVVRHAEKSDDGSRDPPLAPTGLARAQALANALREVPLQAVYATGYRRTQMTAAPAARSHGLAVTTYDATHSAAELAMQLRREHPGGVVLVVGHSNTAPDIAAALCECTVAPMADGDYGRRMTIRTGADGKAVLVEGHY